MLFSYDSSSGGTIDELQVDHIPNTTDDYEEGDDGDDATEFSQRSPFFPYHTIMPSQSLSPTDGGGTIRMEGWLNHTTSSHRNNSSDTANTNPSSASSIATSSILSKTVSKKKKRQTKRNSKQPRYFVLRGGTLSYYARRHDVKAKGTFVLTRGCTVGPVVYGSLDDPPSSMEVAAGVDHQLDELPLSPSTASATTATVDHNYASSSKSKKKRQQFYCVQVTWPIKSKPSKDVKSFFQAKAQVAAESENEAMIQQKQLGLQEIEDSFEDNPTAGISMNNYGNKSPILRPKQLRRTKSESAARSSHLGNHQQSSARNTIESIPPDLFSPNIMGDHHQDDSGHDTNGNNGHEQLRPASLLPVPKNTNSSTILDTPATTMTGVTFHPKMTQTKIITPNENVNNPSSSHLNHETGLHKHYKHQIEKRSRDQQKSAEELQKIDKIIAQKADSYKKTKKRVIQGTKVAAVSTAAITAGILTAGIGLAAGLVFVGITAAAGGSGAVVGSKVLDKAWGKYTLRKSQKSVHLIIGSGTYEEAMKWKMAMEKIIKELVEDSEDEGNEVGEEWGIKQCFSGSAAEDGGVDNNPAAALTSPAALSSPLTPKTTVMLGNNNDHPTPIIMNGGVVGNNGSNIHENAMHYHDMTPKWVPIQGGGMALWGILGALGGGGGNLRIYREERTGPSPYHSYSSAEWLFSQPPVTSAFPTMPRFRSDVGLAGQPFPPFKASIVLKANSLDAFMCLMCSGRVHNEEFNISGGGNGVGSTRGSNRIPMVVPNSGQIASFRIIETMDDHMDVIHLVFRPIYLFPSWTAPRDFVLYRFWKYDDDGTYQICVDSGQHRDCPPVPGYVRGEMHSVYTIAPLKPKKKRGTATNATTATAATTVGGSHKKPPSSASTSSNRPNLMNEECLLSHVVQIDPRGWVPTTSSIPFLRSQGYGDAYAIMALHQMLDVKEALDSARFVAVPMDGTQNTVGQGGQRVKPPRRLLANGNKRGSVGGSVLRGGSRPMQNTSSGLTRGVSDGGAGGQQQQQIYMPILETSDSGDDDDEVDYDFRRPAGSNDTKLFSADGYHQSPPLGASSSTNHNHVRVHIDNANESSQHVDSKKGSLMPLSKISTCPPPMIMDWWGEPDADSFRVRGKTYKTDSKKVNAGSSLFRLFAVDVVETDIPIMTGMCLHPKERVQLALQREREALSNGVTAPSEMPPFVFAVNIALPGPPNYHMVSYYAVDDMSMIDGSDGTPSSKLCQEFFFGNDDAFRDNTFKLIPIIVEGNFMVRKTVGSTPAIMGNKIKQTYVQGKRFFELMIDTGSSAVAAGVIRICNGYAKMIVVDLAFLFEGYNESTLPERILGCVRLKNVEFGKKIEIC